MNPAMTGSEFMGKANKTLCLLRSKFQSIIKVAFAVYTGFKDNYIQKCKQNEI